MVYNINVTKHYVKMEADFPYCSVLYKEKMAEKRLKISKNCFKIVKVAYNLDIPTKYYDLYQFPL
jgi:hypothetical protein